MIYIIGDTHFGRNQNSNDALDESLEFLTNALSDVMPEDTIIFMGDYFDSRQSIGVRVISLAYKFIARLSKIATCYMLVGNHDCYNAYTRDVISIETYRHLENVHIIDEPKVVVIENERFVLLPWEHDFSVLSGWIKKYSKGGGTLCIHNEVKNTKMNAFSEVDYGLDESEIVGFKKVLAGHIHWKQDVHNLTYVGTPYQMSFGCTGNPRGIHTYDPKTGKLTFIENTISPRYIKVNWNDLENVDEEKVKSVVRNNFVEISFNDDSIKSTKINEVSKILEGAKKIRFETPDVVNENYSDLDLPSLDGIQPEKIKPLDLAIEYINKKSQNEDTAKRVCGVLNKYWNEAIQESEEL